MFFLLSKTLDLAFSPLTWAMALVIAGLAIAGRAPARKWLWRVCLTLAVGVLYVFSIQRVSNALERHLEAGARSTMKEGVIYDGVVLLGGIVDILVSEPNRPRAYGENIERLLATYDLPRTGLDKEVVVSSGDGFGREAHVLRHPGMGPGVSVGEPAIGPGGIPRAARSGVRQARWTACPCGRGQARCAHGPARGAGTFIGGAGEGMVLPKRAPSP